MMSPRLRFHRTQGQSVVIVALAIFVLIGVAGLGLDGANAFNRRRNAANAADAAAMAGANVLITQQKASPVGPASAVYSAVSTYLGNHGIDPDDPKNPWTAYYVNSSGNRLGAVSNSSSNVNTSAKGISVDVQNTFDTFFMRVLGRGQLTVGNSATAIFGSINVAGSILPITLSKSIANTMVNNTSYVFNGNPSDPNNIAAGNFGQISLNPDKDIPNSVGNDKDCDEPSGSPDNPSYWWCNGTSHSIDSGQWLWGKPGQIAGQLQYEVQYRIDTNPYGLIPIYDQWNDLNGNNAQYHIVGFMVVELTNQCLNGSGCNPKTITAKYKDYVVSTGAIDPNAPVTSMYAINLIKTPGTLH